jgi:transcriptional regulator with XRE-family HTH domain
MREDAETGLTRAERAGRVAIRTREGSGTEKGSWWSIVASDPIGETQAGGPERFGRWLDLTMGNRNISGRELAKRMRVDDSAVSRWRNGKQSPGMDTCMRLAKVLDVNPLQLAATAGLLDPEETSIDLLPMPEPTAARRYIKAQLSSIKGLTARERQHLMNTYDAMTDEGV